MYDNLGDCFKSDFKRSAYIFAPCVYHIVMGVALSYTVSYQQQRAIVFLLLNFSIANSTLDLMLVNMAKKKFNIVQFTYVYALAPLLICWMAESS